MLVGYSSLKPLKINQEPIYVKLKIQSRQQRSGRIQCSVQVNEDKVASEANGREFRLEYPRSALYTGSMDTGTIGATRSLSGRAITREKYVVIVRHGQTTWNLDGRIQGSSDQSDLTELGQQQAMRVRDALSQQHFDNCFSSPITRARSAAQIIWEGRPGSIVYLESLKEAYLGYLQGMKNSDAAEQYPKEFHAWRENPAAFNIEGSFPVLDVFVQARKAWVQILEAEGSSHLVITHKSILRALLCTALGLPATGFRAIDCHNGGINVFKVNKRGEAMLINLNLTAHMHNDGVKY